MKKPKLKVMADYCSTGLWAENGVNIEPSSVGVSPDTELLLKRWNNIYEDLPCGDVETDMSPARIAVFIAMGKIITKQLRKEIGKEYRIDFKPHVGLKYTLGRIFRINRTWRKES